MDPTDRVSAPLTPDDTTGDTSRRWAVLAVLGVAQLMVVLDATIVNIALPRAQVDLGFDDADRQWVVTAYALAFGSLLLLGGRLTDRIGYRRSLIIGLVGFAAASAVGGWAPAFGVLTTARVAQGLFGALLAPAALSMLSVTFAGSADRDKAYAVFGSIAAAGGAIGLLLGGVLTEYLSWRWTMYVNVFFAAAAVAGALAFVPRARDGAARAHLDLRGTALSIAGLFLVVLGFAQSETAGWGSVQAVVSLLGGASLLAVFVLTQRTTPEPLLPLRVVLDRGRGASYAVMLLTAVGMFAVFLFLTYYLQQTLGYSPVTSGLAFLPMVGAIGLTAPIVGASLRPRFGPRVLVPCGAVLAAGGLILLTGIQVDSSYAQSVLPGLVLVGAGMGAIFANAVSSATIGVDAHDAGVASAVVNTVQQVGGSIGTSLLSSIAAAAATDFASSNPTASASAAAVASYQEVFWWAAGFFVVAAVVAAALYPSGIPEESDVPVVVH